MKAELKILVLLFLAMTPLLEAQSDEQRFSRRIVWRGEHALRYAVEIDRMENGRFQNHLREFTASLFIDVSLPAGEYRFRIIPHDILDRPGAGTQWVRFVIRPTPQPEIIDIDDYDSTGVSEAAQAARDPVAADHAHRFNTLGISVGTTFIDPLITLTLHGTFSPMRNFFIELGCDFGFISKYKEAESFYCIYPFAHLGFFMPLREEVGVFIGVGGGYMTGAYTFPEGKVDINVWGINFTAGINLFDFFNVSYTLRTSFSEASHKIALGYIYRFR